MINQAPPTRMSRVAAVSAIRPAGFNPSMNAASAARQDLGVALTFRVSFRNACFSQQMGQRAGEFDSFSA